MEKTTEELLEEYKITKMVVTYVTSASESNDPKVIKKNETCLIVKIPKEQKDSYEYVAVIKPLKFQKLLAEKKLSSLTNLQLSIREIDDSQIDNSFNITRYLLRVKELDDLIGESVIDQVSNRTGMHFPMKGINSLPAEIGQLINLTELDLSHNELNSLPAEIGQLTKLTRLDLSNNQLTSLPTQIAELASLTRFYIGSNQLTSLPSGISHLANLRKLDISSNMLTDLPKELRELTKLTSLILFSNLLTNLPLVVCQLPDLTWLDLSNNKLTSLPAEICQLSNLIWLGLSDNELNNVPTEIGQLFKLIELDLSNNQLTHLPTQIIQLTNLTKLYVSNNGLTNLPPEIGQLSNLAFLDLQRNELTSLPIGIQNLKALKQLELQNNQLDFPPEIIQRAYNPQAILSYFAWMLDGKKKPLGETKVLVVGQGSVGKSSLVERLVAGTFDPHKPKTDGIAIAHWQVENQINAENEPHEIALRIWDFGGQEIMHATHQFFLTKRSLYVLVLDARLTQEENRVEYWLKIIQSFGGEAPVLLVGNKIDQHPLDIDRTGLQKKYPNIVGILETSAENGTGLEALKDAITAQVNGLPHIRDPFPESWFTVKTALQELGRASNFITHDKYIELCIENKVNDEISQRTLIGFLHDLGVALHFQDDPRLEALGILNPQWVTNGVYKILNAESLFHNRGQLTMPMLNEILHLDGYPRDKRLFIVDMMKKFELCYDIEPDHTFLVPDLLPKDEPPLDFDGIPAFEYAYPVLPSSVMTRFIVRMNQKIDGGLVWRTGILLQIGQNRALVRADLEDGKIVISISGMEHTRRDALAAIRYQLDEIHVSIKGLNPQKMVPIPNAPSAKPLEYETLLMLEREGQEEYPVRDGNRLVKVNVREVLSGIEREFQRRETGGHTTTNIYVGGNFDGILTVGDGNQAIKDSYKKITAASISPELQQTLHQLTAAVATMTKELPEEERAEITDDLSKLVDEAISPKPNKKWYAVSITGLMKAAQNLDGLGQPVIHLSQKVLALLAGR